MTSLNDPIESDAELAAKEAKAQRRAQREVEDLKWILADPRGRRFIARLLDRAGVHRSSFNNSGSVMAFNEGRREMGLFITAEVLEHAPKAYHQLLNEYRNDD